MSTELNVSHVRVRDRYRKSFEECAGLAAREALLAGAIHENDRPRRSRAFLRSDLNVTMAFEYDAIALIVVVPFDQWVTHVARL